LLCSQEQVTPHVFNNKRMLDEVVHVVLDEPGFDGAFEGFEHLDLAIPRDFWAKVPRSFVLSLLVGEASNTGAGFVVMIPLLSLGSNTFSSAWTYPSYTTVIWILKRVLSNLLKLMSSHVSLDCFDGVSTSSVMLDLM